MSPSNDKHVVRDPAVDLETAGCGAGWLLRIQRDLAVSLVGCSDLEDCLCQVMNHALRLPGVDRGGAFVVDPGVGGVRLAAGRDLPVDLQRMMEFHAEAGSSGGGDAAREVRHFSVEGGSRIEGGATEVQGTAGWTAISLVSAGRLAGWVGLAAREGGVLSAGTLQALEKFAAFARHLMLAIHARQIRRDADRELQLAVAGAGLGSWEVDLTRMRVLPSGRAKELHGISGEGPFGLKAALRAVHPSDRGALRAGVRHAVRTRGAISLEYRTVDGARWISMEARYFDEPSRCLLGVSRDITRRKQMEAGAAGYESRLKEMVDQRAAELASANAELVAGSAAIKLALEGSGAGGWHLDMASGRVHLDAVCREMYGFAPDEKLTLSGMAKRFHPESRERIFSRLSEVAMPGPETDWDQEFQIEHPERGLRWLSGRGRIFRDEAGGAVEMAGINIDITGRKEAEVLLRRWNEELERKVEIRTRELRESEARFRSLAEATFDGVAISRDGIIDDLNSQAAAMFGYEPGEVLGRPILDFVSPESLESVMANLTRHREEAYEWTGMRKDGSRIPVESRAKLLDWKGRGTRVTLIRDLSEAKRVSAEIAARRGELERSRGLALMGEICAGIVHQISQPLSAVAANLAAMKVWRHDCNNPCCKVPGAVDEVAGHVARMRDIVRHLRTVAGPRAVISTAISINQVVCDALPLLKLEAETRRIGLEIGLEQDLPEVSADHGQLVQLLVHLVRNALDACGQATMPGMIRIVTRLTPDRLIELTVSDTGGGLPGEIRGRMFAPFLSTKPGASGIGLRLCQMIAHAHGGRIEGGDNPDGIGACFRVFLPVLETNGHTKV